MPSHIQDKHHKKMKKQEMKVFTMYEGWDEEQEKQKRSTLVGKNMLAGMENSTEFHAKREACIRKKYAADEIEQRILNGDGGSWIKEPYDPETTFNWTDIIFIRKCSEKSATKKHRKKSENYLMKKKWRKCWSTFNYMLQV